MLLDALFRADPLENPANPLTGDFDESMLALSGVSVTPETGMKLAAVYSCIYVLSSSIAQLPLHVLRNDGNKVEKATDHPLWHLLKDGPNDWQSSYDWREMKQAYTSGHGNGLTRIIRNRRGQVESLELCKPWMSTLVKRGNRYIYAVLDDDQGPMAVQPYDMLHMRCLGSDGRWGKSPIRQHAETIGLGLAAQRYGATFFGQNGRPSALVTAKGNLTKESWERLKERWRQATSALRQEDNKALLLPAELDYHQITVPPEEAQFLETRKFSRSEIAGIFNVPAHMINDLEKATFSNISEQAIQFVRHTMMPWVVKYEQEMNRKLFTEQERKAGYYVKFNLAGLLRGTPKERAEFYHFAITDGWMNRNEARVFEDMNPVPGLDEFLVSVNASKPTDQPEDNNNG